MLRQRDYIADNAGYRILKSKNVYVGRNINVGDAVKAAKKLPSAGGSLVKNYHQRRPVVYSSGRVPPSSTYGPIVSSTPKTYVDITSNSILSGPLVTSTEAPVVEITPHSYINPTSTYLPPTHTYSSPSSSYLPPVNFTREYLPPDEPPRVYLPSTTEAPRVRYTSTTTSTYLPPVTEPPRVYLPSTTESPRVYLPPVTEPPRVYLPSTTESPKVYLPPVTEPPRVYLPSTTEVPHVYLPPVTEPPRVYLPSTTEAPKIYLPPVTEPPRIYLPSTTEAPRIYLPPNTESPTYLPPARTYLPSSTQSPKYLSSDQYDLEPISGEEADQNSVEYNPYVRQVDNSYRFQNGPTYPIDRNGRPYDGQTQDSSHDPQYARYDGVSVTNDGFRYYIPRAYHEEETLPGDKRSGSFGYIDPFGIRRVIYYNTAPGEGFKHRKNNRYVGFDATPYDPRPV
ncbi:unnamed protein product [Acanthoscelides obtectus]|uniref:Uncharacterized protein n=1 Tax=Acanthoscelides obtectus TaxID=200917 RepID=A0A9P0MBN6_ACAOB|nr:unnamed protein product [Acanthoscelides obtectus]CAK1677615.1 Repetitive proline-rich cell wall protein 2 [Acanthoscelides obtectus]